MDLVDKKIEIWKKKLLDLGKKNRLINYRDTKRSTLTITNPSIFDLWNRLVQEEEPLIFPLPKDEFEDEFAENDDEEKEVEEKSSDFPHNDLVITDQNVREMQSTLRNLRSKAKTSFEEQGINLLFLAFGFLNWTEDPRSNVPLLSPLILVPVSLTVESISAPFVLQRTDDDIVVNPALVHKMESEYGLTFPEFDEEKGLQDFLNSVQEIIQSQWTVENKVVLSLFSFTKINMYNDLVQNRDRIASNQIVRAIAGDASAKLSVPKGLDNYDFDEKQKPIEVFQVVDADSSQQEAILYAKKGASFVLQGPPGTGKSQTITNIIAELLAEGKKVLFVAEKMAALDAVYKRLDSSQISDFCLVLHNWRANKKDVLEQLQTSLDLAGQKASITEDARRQLAALHKDVQILNAYAKQIFEKVSPLDKTIYEVNGYIANLSDYPDVTFDIPNVRDADYDQYLEYLQALEDYKKPIVNASESFETNPWRDCTLSAISYEIRQEASARLPETAETLSEINNKAQEIFSSLGLLSDCSYRALKDVMRLFEIARRSPKIPYSWLKDANKASSYWKVDADLNTLYRDVNTYKEKSEDFEAKVSDLQELYEAINLSEICNLEIRNTVDLNSCDAITSEQRMLDAFLENNAVFSRMNSCQNLNSVIKERQKADQYIKHINASKDALSSRFVDGIFGIDSQRILAECRHAYQSFSKEIERDDPFIGEHARSSSCFPLIPEDWLREDLNAMIAEVEDFKNEREKFYEDFEELKGVLAWLTDNNVLFTSSLDQLTSPEKLNKTRSHIVRYVNNNPFIRKIYDEKSFEACQKEFAIVESSNNDIRGMEEELLQTFERDVFKLDYDGMIDRYKLRYSSPLKYLSVSYYADRRKMRLLYKQISPKTDLEFEFSALQKLREIGQIRETIASKCNHLAGAFGEKFLDEGTDLQTISKRLAVYEKVIRALTLISEMLGVIKKSESENENLTRRYGAWYKGFDTAWDHILKALHGVLEIRTRIRANRGEIEQYSKGYEELTDKSVLDLLLTLETINKEREAIKDHCSHFASVMSGVFEYEKTDFHVVDKYFSTYNALLSGKEILDELHSIMSEFVSNERGLKKEFDFLYEGVTTPWKKVEDAIRWAKDFSGAIRMYSPSDEFVKHICSDTEAIEISGQYCDLFSEMLQKIDVNFKWFASLFESPEQFEKMNAAKLAERMSLCTDRLDSLEKWIDYRNAREKCKDIGLSDYIRVVEERGIEPDSIIGVFKKRFYLLWLDKVLPQYPAVERFRQSNHESTIREFAELDKKQFAIASAQIRSRLINSFPVFDGFTSGSSEISILKRELGKKRRVMSIRRLFGNIPGIMQTLKPCMMMSPLSVSLFLESNAYQFDVVIFDEASQVCTENAIGAISRGMQVIIAGDKEQLPPTNFFSASTASSDDYDSKDDEEDEEAKEECESVLDEVDAKWFPQKRLLWHYRSRNEELIAFSNAKFYKNALVTFPSNVERSPNNGVEYIYTPDGTYDRGGRKGNIVEAKKVAELVFQHFKNFPGRSLGVIAFGETQQQAIEVALRERRMKDPTFEPFFNEENEEAFFIKNLENVQGDERDTIIFSIGYAKDQNGVFRMNFGPLSLAGGERRLNVAITRAKYNVKLVGSILPGEIAVDRIKSEGPKLLNDYIRFAKEGVSSLLNEITESEDGQCESPFEEAVYNFLARKGYKLARQVGCSGYRIDMAVRHPTIHDRYVLGIECDGATYHSGKTARERDRLRQDVLESMGWRICRVWSTDWIKDPITSGKLLAEKVENAIKSFRCEEPIVMPSVPLEANVADFVTVEEKLVSEGEKNNPYGFREEPTIHFPKTIIVDNEYLSDCIKEMVNKLYPIHYDLVCKQVADLMGSKRVTETTKRTVNWLLHSLREEIIKRAGFLYPKDYETITPRINNRAIEHVSIEELAEAVYVVLSQVVGYNREQLCIETARAYNFGRMTKAVVTAMDQAFDLLLKQNRVEFVGDKVRVRQFEEE